MVNNKQSSCVRLSKVYCRQGHCRRVGSTAGLFLTAIQSLNFKEGYKEQGEGGHNPPDAHAEPWWVKRSTI